MTSVIPLPQPNLNRHPFLGMDILRTAGYRTKPGMRGPCFDQDIWDLTAVADAPASWPRSEKILDFTTITNPRWRNVARAYLMARILPTHPDVAVLPHAYRTPLALPTLRHEVNRLTAWFNHLTAAGINSLSLVRQPHCDAYLSVVSRSRTDPERSVTPGTVAGYVLTAQALTAYSPLLPDCYTPGFRPWGDRSAAEVAGYERADVNQTAPVPDDILRPLLCNSIYLIDMVGPHVAAEATRARQAITSRAGIRSSLRLDQYSQVIDEVQRQMRAGVPAPRTTPGYIARRLAAGWEQDDPLLPFAFDSFVRDTAHSLSKRRDLERLRPHLEAWIRHCGTEPPWCRDATAVPRADDQSAVPFAIPVDHFEMETMVHVIASAAFYLTAALSGMRASELAELTGGACRRENRSQSPRFWVDSRRIKGEDFGGVPDSWVVIEEVHRALAAAEAVTGTKPGELLFSSGSNSGNRYTALRNWVNGSCGQRLGLAPIPDGPVHPRALRRTLALSIAQRPHGLLAAKWHLKHVSVATTEGYAARPGGHQAAFLAEVQAEEEAEHIRLTAAAYESYRQGELPSGRGARDLIAAFRAVDDELAAHETQPPVLADDRRLERLLKTRAKTLHVGAANYCWFTDPKKALCLTLAGTPDATEPLIGMCDSARCPQATHHPQHRQTWVDQAKNTQEVFLGNPRLAPLERRRAEDAYDRAMRIVDAIDAASTGLNSEGTDSGQ
ncbi:integrase [Streptomyces sp. NPDC001591]|uniref:integrase n=1 Tax=Streptomyces sp. NPDC001591 TaxID=3364589 RepID=UPI0036981A0C